MLLFFPSHVYASLNRGSGTDTCGKISVDTTETPFCPRLYGSGTNENINSYGITVKITSADGHRHNFTYHPYTNFCTGPYLDASGRCSDNTLDSGSLDASTPFSITLNRSPNQGAYCGNYQLDLLVTSIDGDSNCIYRINNASGVAGVCETGYDCSANATPTPSTYTISGKVFNDLNKDDVIDNGETNYTGGITIANNGGTTTTNNGAYTISGLSAGTYTVSYTNLPNGYYTVYPKNGPPPSFLVTVGRGCRVDSTTGGACSNGNIDNLNFAISNANPWVQLIDLDGRVDTGFKTTIPATANRQCGAYASTQDINANTPGIPFSGDTMADFGEGKASSKNWVVGGSIYPETVSQIGESLRTAYTSLNNTIMRAGLTMTNISTISGCSNLNNCTLPDNLANGIYQANGNLTLNGYMFPANKNYIFLIKGDLTIMGNITIPIGSTALFSTAGDIFVDKGVKAAANSCPAPTGQLQGVFSADKNITVEGINDCSLGTDTMLNIEGSIVMNAARGGGTFTNNRDLCSDNAQYPSVTIKSRPDFLFNAPNIISQQNTYSIEAAN